MATKEQKRSAFALSVIDSAFSGKVKKEDANFIVGLPTMILQNGFAQTLAFLYSKAKGDTNSKYFKSAGAILDWAEKCNAGLGTNYRMALGNISNLDADKYLMVQQEALAMLNWLKRYARAFQEGK